MINPVKIVSFKTRENPGLSSTTHFVMFKKVENWEQSNLTLDYFCLPCYMQDTDKVFILINNIIVLLWNKLTCVLNLFYIIVPKEEPVQIQIDEQAQLTIVSNK